MFLNIGGVVGVRCQDATTTLAGLDALHVPAGAVATMWNSRDEPARLLRLEEGVA